jgi:hypothetical protein
MLTKNTRNDEYDLIWSSFWPHIRDKNPKVFDIYRCDENWNFTVDESTDKKVDFKNLPLVYKRSYLVSIIQTKDKDGKHPLGMSDVQIEGWLKRIEGLDSIK